MLYGRFPEHLSHNLCGVTNCAMSQLRCVWYHPSFATHTSHCLLLPLVGASRLSAGFLPTCIPFYFHPRTEARVTNNKKNNSNTNIPVPTRNDSTQKTLSDEKEIDKMIEIVTVYKHIDLWQVCPGTMNRLVCPLRFDKACPGERIALERAAIPKLAASAKVSAVEKVWLGTIKFLCADFYGQHWPMGLSSSQFKNGLI